MAVVNIPNSIFAGQPLVAAPVHENFEYVEDVLNDQMMHADGSKAFTSVPSGPAMDPMTDNHLVRKKYVDDRQGRILSLYEHNEPTLASGAGSTTHLGVGVPQFQVPSLTAEQALEISMFIPRFRFQQFGPGGGYANPGTACMVELSTLINGGTVVLQGWTTVGASSGATSWAAPSVYARRVVRNPAASFGWTPGQNVTLRLRGRLEGNQGNMAGIGSSAAPIQLMVRVV